MGRHPIFSMVWLSFLRGLLLERLSIIMPKASTIRLKNSSDLIGFQLKVTELLNEYNPPYLFNLKVKY